jgi:hypothetical protein
MSDPDSFRVHLVGIAQIEASQVVASGDQWIGQFELEIRASGAAAEMPCCAALRWDR